MNMSVTNAPTAAIRATESVLRRVLRDNDNERELEILHFDVSDPKPDNAWQREIGVKMRFLQHSEEGSVLGGYVWVFVTLHQRGEGLACTWKPFRASITARNGIDPEGGTEFLFEDGRVLKMTLNEEPDSIHPVLFTKALEAQRSLRL